LYEGILGKDFKRKCCRKGLIVDELKEGIEGSS
jgi:hypothetical protein